MIDCCSSYIWLGCLKGIYDRASYGYDLMKRTQDGDHLILQACQDIQPNRTTNGKGTVKTLLQVRSIHFVSPTPLAFSLNIATPLIRARRNINERAKLSFSKKLQGVYEGRGRKDIPNQAQSSHPFKKNKTHSRLQPLICQSLVWFGKKEIEQPCSSREVCLTKPHSVLVL